MATGKSIVSRLFLLLLSSVCLLVPAGCGDDSGSDPPSAPGLSAAGSAAVPAETASTDVPPPCRSATFPAETSPVAVAVSPDGRRLFVVSRDPGAVRVFDVDSGELLATTAVAAARGLAVSPDGEILYVAGRDGISVLPASGGTAIATLTPAGADAAMAGSQALAASPDGELLFVADPRDGGEFTLWSLPAGQALAGVALGPGFTPRGLAVSPDGGTAWLAFAASAGPGTLAVFDLRENGVIATIAVGRGPAAVAFSPSADRICVGNELDGTVSVLDAATLRTLAVVPVGERPAGVAITPEGRHAWVANRGSDTVSVIDLAAGEIVATVQAGAGPAAIAFGPQGRCAFLAEEAAGSVALIEGPYTLTVDRAGRGFGEVTSSPPGIACGDRCQASFTAGTLVALAATPDDFSVFAGWEGDPDCSDGIVTMTADRACTAIFETPPPDGDGHDSNVVFRGSCFIATAAYGSPLHPHVQALRDFRDRVLLNCEPGRRLVALYERYSPPLADCIARHASLRFAARLALTPLILAVRFPALFLAAIIGLGAAAAWRWSRRGAG